MKHLDTIKIFNKNQTKFIAHRGLSGLEKENTMCAFVSAGARSYYGMECDIHKTKDNKYVVCHDENIKRVSGIDVNINALTYDEISKIELIDNFDNTKKSYLTIPLFEDYLDCAKKYNKYCIIELKDDFLDDDISTILNYINAIEYKEKCIIISFSLSNLVKVRQVDRTIKMQYLVSEYSKNILDTCVMYNMGIDINYTGLTKKIIDDFHKFGLDVNVWTVNDCDDAIKFIDYGVDYITTNILE